MSVQQAKYHLPGLFEFYEFYELYKLFLPLFFDHREYFYEWCRIESVYGAPSDCLWGGGRIGDGNQSAREVLDLVNGYGISARLTFSNSLLQSVHLSDKKCNKLCRIFNETVRAKNTTLKQSSIQNGVIIHSDLLLNYMI